MRPETATSERAPTPSPVGDALIPKAEHVRGKIEQQGIEREHQHLPGRIRSMHAFLRNVHAGFDRLVMPAGDSRLRQLPRLVRAWNEVPACLRAT